jgi:hypothetical protein
MIRCLPAFALWTILILQNTVQDACLRSKTLSVALILPAKSPRYMASEAFLFAEFFWDVMIDIIVTDKHRGSLRQVQRH